MSLSLSEFGVGRQDAEKFVLAILPEFGKHKGIKNHSDLTKSLDEVFDTIATTAKTRGLTEAKAGNVTVTHGGKSISYGARKDGHWNFPWSGRICIFFCPDGKPPNPEDWWDECYWICIDWSFP